MSSISIMDFFTDKLLAFSMKLIDSSKLSGSSFLLSGNNNVMSHQPYDVLNELTADDNFNSTTLMPLKQPLAFSSGNYSLNFVNTEKSFSHHLYNSGSYDKYPRRCSSESLLSPNSILFDKLMLSAFLNQPAEMDKKLKSDVFLNQSVELGKNLKSDVVLNQPVEMSRNLKSGVILNQPVEMSRNLNSEFSAEETSVLTATEIKMPISISHSQRKKRSETINIKCNIPNTSTLNKQLANRKTKEILKRSKKRRRRQKKNHQSDCSSSASISDDEVDGLVTSASCVCLVTKNTTFGCAITVSHSMQTPPHFLSSFIVPVGNASDDDSEWETYDVSESDSSSQSNKNSDSNNKPSVVSSEVNSGSTDSKCSQLVESDLEKTTSFLASFIIPAECSTDDESDWDSCETDVLNEMSEFEFSGLFLTNLCNPQIFSSDTDNINNFDQDDETIKLKAHLQEVNKIWNKSTKGIDMKQKSRAKVSFAPEEVLVEVFPVDICERKGEWETYATERLRFKRKIEEIEKILSPCLNAEHRSKVLKKLNEPTL